MHVAAFAFALLAAAFVPNGRLLFDERCATCHGANLRGGANGPSLRGVGAADVDFWLETGRMPAAVPWIEIGHQPAHFSRGEIAALVDYVTRAAPGGPAIPAVGAHGNPEHGLALYRVECMGCHGADAAGAAIGGYDWAPNLAPATPVEIAEAIRVGPWRMPVFGEAQLNARDVDDIVAYLRALRVADRPHPPPFSTSGPVPEGLLGWLTAAALALVAYAFARPRSA